MNAVRKRLSSADSRAAALEAAQQILVEQGPQAVTLKLVASAIGRTHANLLHHFGTAADLQKALAAHVADKICANVRATMEASRMSGSTAREVVEMVFDAYEHEGGAHMIGWMWRSGEVEALGQITGAIQDLMCELHAFTPEHSRQLTLMLSLMALGDALIGTPLCDALALPRHTSREQVGALLAREVAWLRITAAEADGTLDAMVGETPLSQR